MCSERERSFCSLEALGWKLWSLLSDCHCSPKEGSDWGNKLSSMALRGRVRASFGLRALSPNRAGTASVLSSARATQRVCALSAALSSGVLGVLWCSGAGCLGCKQTLPEFHCKQQLLGSKRHRLWSRCGQSHAPAGHHRSRHRPTAGCWQQG